MLQMVLVELKPLENSLLALWGPATSALWISMFPSLAPEISAIWRSALVACTPARVSRPGGPRRSGPSWVDWGRGGTNLGPSHRFSGSGAIPEEFWLMRDFYLALKASSPGLQSTRLDWQPTALGL